MSGFHMQGKIPRKNFQQPSAKLMSACQESYHEYSRTEKLAVIMNCAQVKLIQLFIGKFTA